MKTIITKEFFNKFVFLLAILALPYTIMQAQEEDTVKKVVEVYAFNTPPTIDGIIDDSWSSNEFQNIDNIIQRESSKTELNENDFSAKFKISWYDDKFYFLVVVTDEDLFTDGNEVWENDHFMLVLDLGNEKTYNWEDSTSSILLDDNDHNIVIPWGQPELIYAFSGYENINNFNPSLYEYGETIDLENKTYVAEFAFDVKEYNMPAGLREDTEIGFDIIARDYDLNLFNGVYYPEQEIWASWYSTSVDGWFNRALLGSVGLAGIKLKSANAPTAIQNNKYNSNITLYPVPASDILNIQSDINIEFIQIYNILGAQVLSSHLDNNSVDVSGLLKGIYTINMYDETGNTTSQKIIIE